MQRRLMSATARATYLPTRGRFLVTRDHDWDHGRGGDRCLGRLDRLFRGFAQKVTVGDPLDAFLSAPQLFPVERDLQQRPPAIDGE